MGGRDAPAAFVRGWPGLETRVFWSKWKKFLTEVRTELKRTTWPNRTEVRNTTLVVLVTTFIFALFLGVVDLVLKDLLSRILGAFSG